LENPFSGFGINAPARRYGFDKQLIFRDFGGLEGLIDAIGDDLAGWTTTHLEHLVGTLPVTGCVPLLEAVLTACLDALPRRSSDAEDHRLGGVGPVPPMSAAWLTDTFAALANR